MDKKLRIYFATVVICCFLASNIYAQEFRMKVKDPENAYSTAVFPGVLLSGAPYLYLGDIAGGTLRTGADVFCLSYISNVYKYIGTRSGFLTKVFNLPFLLAPAAYLVYARYENMKYIEERTVRWNNAVETMSYAWVKGEYKKNALFYTGMGGITLLGGLFLNDSNSAFSILPGSSNTDVLLLGGTFLASAGVYFLQYKYLDDRIYSGRGIPSFPTLVVPVVSSDYKGILIAGRF